MYTVEISLNGIKYLMRDGIATSIIEEFKAPHLKSLNTLAIRTVGFRLFECGL
jgi:hypothetical protein